MLGKLVLHVELSCLSMDTAHLKPRLPAGFSFFATLNSGCLSAAQVHHAQRCVNLSRVVIISNSLAGLVAHLLLQLSQISMQMP